MAASERQSDSNGAVAVLAEKPSVARDIARVLGANAKGDGYLHGNGYVITWAIGHLAALAQPHEINPAWRQWRRDTLPMLPGAWPLVVYDKTKDQFEVVRKILNSPKIAEIVCATDAGREGELIFRYIYEAAQCSKPVRRLWISSLTPDAIRTGFNSLRDGHDYDPLADAARGRSRADWLVGMNLSRAYSLTYQEDLSVGRVQTPTLAMVVERELAIRNFVVEEYFEVQATFHPKEAPAEHQYRGTWFRERPPKAAASANAGSGKEAEEAARESLQEAMRLPADGLEAKQIAARARSGDAAIESIESETQRMAPPPFYDLTELQRHANRLFGLSAQQTLDVAQSLYEKHKLISYPRTDSRHLSKDVAATLPRIVRNVEGPYRQHVAAGTGQRPLGRRFVDDAKVTDHHAIIPTATSAQNANLTTDEKRIYDLICRRLLMAWHDDHIWSVTTVITVIRNDAILDRYHASGTAVQQVGWKVLDVAPPAKKQQASKSAGGKGKADGDAEAPRGAEQKLPPGLAVNQPQDVVSAEAVKKKTRPPKRFTEATLLTAMETAGKTLDEKELSEAMKETGLGTPATRAAIIEVLLKRAYIERNGKSLQATDKGIRLIQVVHPEVKSPAMTGQWEAFLARIQKGKDQLDPFLRGIEDYVREVVGKVGREPARPRQQQQQEPLPPPPPPPDDEEPPPRRQRRFVEDSDGGGTAARRPLPAAAAVDRQANLWEPAPGPVAGPAAVPASASAPAGTPNGGSTSSLTALLQRTFGFASFRTNQEAVCQAAIDGRDVLLVMPTGSGKSLCYQLPGVARGGTTLVISPLIALMEDQVAKLRDAGFRVDRIHSNRDRASSRQACIDYLAGHLHFLFIAPERLRVAGFPEMLAKRKPSLVAIDEAHCISQWGHDFRPDYRQLGHYVPTLRPAPVIALTATATPRVQDDIVTQLGMAQGARFIHGFRRDNIAIEVVEIAPSLRAGLTLDLLVDPARRPAIVYAPTRKQVESLSAELSAHFAAAPYHAGLEAQHRKRVQEDFQAGTIDVMVATIAFGMGIDKPDIRTIIHTALPGSLEAYYQEIGRAGRDGQPSRAILMHSYADRYTHDFFFERDYPPVEVLDQVFGQLGPEAIPTNVLRAKLRRMDADIFDKALEKLWIHGGAMIDYAENVTGGQPGWRDSYLTVGEQKRAQLDLILRYAEINQCRMSALVRHFGDLADSRTVCGMCDFCAPSQCAAQEFREPTRLEKETAARVLEALDGGQQRSTGRLHGDLFPREEVSRDEFEELLAAMGRAGLVVLSDAVFEKDGRRIPYRQARLSDDGLALAGEPLSREHVDAMASLIMREPAAKSTDRKRRKTAGAGRGGGTGGKRKAAKQSAVERPAVGRAGSALEEALRAWRLAEARKLGVPAFRVFTDKTLQAIAETRPQTATELLAIPGIGLRAVEKYGHQLYRLIERHG